MQHEETDDLPENLAYQPGTRIRRIGAFIIDMLLLGAIGFALIFLIPSVSVALGRWAFLAGYCIAGAYFTICDSALLNGQTVGKKVLNLRVVYRDGSTIGVPIAAARFLLSLTPWFFNGAPLPAEWITGLILSSVLSLLVFGLGLSNLYLFFATGTKQGFHDLVCKTYVVTSPLTTHTRQQVPKPHVIVVALLLVLSLLVPMVATRMVASTDQIDELAIAQREIDRLDNISYSSITDMTNYANDTQVTYVNIVLVKPERSSDDIQIAREACKILKDSYPHANKRDFINVRFNYGQDIGIASYWRSVEALRVNQGESCY